MVVHVLFMCLLCWLARGEVALIGVFCRAWHIVVLVLFFADIDTEFGPLAMWYRKTVFEWTFARPFLLWNCSNLTLKYQRKTLEAGIVEFRLTSWYICHIACKIALPVIRPSTKSGVYSLNVTYADQSELSSAQCASSCVGTKTTLSGETA